MFLPDQALVEGHMLTGEEEANLRESLSYREEDRWLHLLYRCALRASETKVKQDDVPQASRARSLFL